MRRRFQDSRDMLLIAIAAGVSCDGERSLLADNHESNKREAGRMGGESRSD